MDLKTFQASTMAEALAMVKRHFGPEAVILHTRTVNQGGVLGYKGRRRVEITAARDGFSLPPGSERGRFTPTDRGRGRSAGAAAMPASDTASKTQQDQQQDQLAPLVSELKALRTTVDELVADPLPRQAPTWPASLQQHYEKLIAADVSTELATRLLRRVQNELTETELHSEEAVRNKLADFVKSMLPVAGPLGVCLDRRPTIAALVGPTGVGKTTTLAKLAAHFALHESRTVGLITTDTYRIAAVDQLKTYADVLNVPLRVVTTAGEMQQAISAFAERDLILIDTTGRGPYDAARIMQLKELLDAAKPHEVHLVLSATHHNRVLRNTIDRFAVLGVNRVILSKIDEAVGLGVILDCLKQVQGGLSYVTTGQNVPDDIADGRGLRWDELILSAAAQP